MLTSARRMVVQIVEIEAQSAVAFTRERTESIL